MRPMPFQGALHGALLHLQTAANLRTVGQIKRAEEEINTAAQILEEAIDAQIDAKIKKAARRAR